MNSIFLRLYSLIVLTVLVVGFSLDFVWRQFEPPTSENSQLEQSMRLAVLHLNSLENQQLENSINQLNQISNGSYRILSTQETINHSFYQAVEPGKLILTENANQLIAFANLERHNRLLEFTTQQNQPTNTLRIIFVTLFYGLIAIAVFYWIWPLSKDLNRLEKAVSHFDQNHWQSKVELPATSSVSHLAKAYNQLLDRIRLLIETQQAMSHSISHELRTPLARVRFSLQMAAESNNTQDIKTQLQSVMDDVVEMNQLINELLNFASLEKITMTAKLERGNINLLIEHLISRLARNLVDKDISFSAEPFGESVLCDSYLIERAVQNLVINAGKFARSKIVVNFEQQQQFYQISVEDDGSGIEPTMRETVFNSFVQLPQENKNQGFGLGLAIVKRIMDLHHGSAIAESSHLGGARFVLSWPIPDKNTNIK